MSLLFTVKVIAISLLAGAGLPTDFSSSSDETRFVRGSSEKLSQSAPFRPMPRVEIAPLTPEVEKLLQERIQSTATRKDLQKQIDEISDKLFKPSDSMREWRRAASKREKDALTRKLGKLKTSLEHVRSKESSQRRKITRLALPDLEKLDRKGRREYMDRFMGDLHRKGLQLDMEYRRFLGKQPFEI